ncbi:MAG: hypothetical protein WCX82_04850 [archaeon]
MKIKKGLREKIVRDYLTEVYSNKKELVEITRTRPLSLGHYGGINLHLLNKGFNIVDSNEPDKSGKLRHIPFTNRHYLIDLIGNEHLTIVSGKFTDLYDLIPGLNIIKIEKHLKYNLTSYSDNNSTLNKTNLHSGFKKHVARKLAQFSVRN